MRLSLLLPALLPAALLAQVPQAFEFQGVARNASGDPLPSQTVALRLGVIASTPTGTLEYQETQTTTTSPLGLFTVQVGSGTPVLGSFAAIGWSTGPRYLKVELDPAGGTAYLDMGTSQLLSVPYALVAGRTSCSRVSLLGDTLYQAGGCPIIVPGISAANGGCLDIDGDGYYDLADCSDPPDCNDNDPATHPEANEVCDGFDNDCDGNVDEGIDLSTDFNNCGACGVACDDGNACTTDACTAGQCIHTPQPGTCLIAGICYTNGTPRPDFPCQVCNSAQNPTAWSNAASGTSCPDGTCNGSGTCVQCVVAANCPGTDTECRTRTCTGGVCGFTFAAAGTVAGSQTAGDCQLKQCDGSGNIISIEDNADVPVDGQECTQDVCNAGAPSNPPVIANTPCSQGGGTICNGSGSCIPVPTVTNVTPTNGATPVAGSNIATITFSTAMNPATLSAQTVAGPCSGSIQCSADDFATCTSFAIGIPTMTVGNTVAQVTPAPGSLVNRTYKYRVTTAAQSSGGVALASTFTQSTGFTTTSPNLGNQTGVISQVYGGGGSTAGTPNADFIELHNRGTNGLSIAGWSVQYASATGSTWTVIPLVGSTLSAGRYYLIRTQAVQATGTALPTPDATSTAIDMSATAGKVALVNNTTPLSGTCPTSANIMDFVGYGATANCREGSTNAPAPSTTTALLRVATACADVNGNSSDFTTGTPAPKNTALTGQPCSNIIHNESGAAGEADYCTVSFPLSLSVQTGQTSATVFGQIFESGVTESAGANADVRAQLGYGEATLNPQYQTWTWTNATFNTQVGNNDEYQATFVAPAVGTWRYTYRFSLDQGVTWTVADANTGDFGAGSNPGLTLEFPTLPVLTVTP